MEGRHSPNGMVTHHGPERKIGLRGFSKGAARLFHATPNCGSLPQIVNRLLRAGLVRHGDNPVQSVCGFRRDTREMGLPRVSFDKALSLAAVRWTITLVTTLVRRAAPLGHPARHSGWGM